jgi:hypothetical protein
MTEDVDEEENGSNDDEEEPKYYPGSIRCFHTISHT